MRKFLLVLGLSGLAFADEVFVDVPITINNTGGCVFDNLPSVIDLGSVPFTAYGLPAGSSVPSDRDPIYIPVKCTAGVNYTLSFTGLTSAGGATAVLQRSSISETVRLYIYRDSARTQTITSTNPTIATGTGDGTTQNIAIYPRISECATSTCPPGTYSRTLTLRITY